MTVNLPPPQSPSKIAVTDAVAGMRRHRVPILGRSARLALNGKPLDPGPWLVNVKADWIGGGADGYTYQLYIGFYSKQDLALLQSVAWKPAWGLRGNNDPARRVAMVQADTLLECMPPGDWPAGGTNNNQVVFEYDWYLPGGPGATLAPRQTQLGSAPWLSNASWNGGGAMSWSDVGGEVGAAYHQAPQFGHFTGLSGSIMGPDNRYYPLDATGWDTYTPDFNPALLPAADPLAEFDCPVVVVILKWFATIMTYGLYPPAFVPGHPGNLIGGTVTLYNKVKSMSWSLKTFASSSFLYQQGVYKRLVVDQHQKFIPVDAANYGSNVTVGWADISQPPDAPTTFGGAVSVKSGLF